MNSESKDSFEVNRRQFLASAGLAGGAALTLKGGQVAAHVNPVMGAIPLPGDGPEKPRIHVGFIQSPPGQYNEMGWPGMEYDSDASQALYTKTIEEAAAEAGVVVNIENSRLGNDGAMDAFLAQALSDQADGVILINMEAQTYGVQGFYRFLEQRGDQSKLPLIGFVPHGTLHHHPGDYDPFRSAPNCFLAASADISWLATAVRMLKARWQMAHTRLAVVTGDQESEQRLEPLGTVVCSIPMEHYKRIEATTDGAREVREIARLYLENAKDRLEPSEEEVFAAARAYVANRRLLEEKNCHGVAINCFQPVTHKEIIPPCLAFMQLLDEGSVGVCEADVFPGLTQLLSRYLLDMPGFLHNPIHDTTRNLYAGGHCTAPTRMAGLNQAPEPYILRSHHEAGFGAVPQVLFKKEQPATLWRFLSPDTLMIATGSILWNVDTHPDDGTGGCRTSFVMEMDDVPDVRQIRGHHKILTYGKHLHSVRAWADLTGVKLEHITGGEV